MIPTTFLSKGLDRDQWICAFPLNGKKYEIAWQGNSLVVISPKGGESLPRSKDGSPIPDNMKSYIHKRVDAWLPFFEDILKGDTPPLRDNEQYGKIDMKLFDKAMRVIKANTDHTFSIRTMRQYIVIESDLGTYAVLGAMKA